MLRYHQYSADTPIAGRRLRSHGELTGVLHTLGYYSTDVCIGTPPRRFELIIDTGSAITAVPCAGCERCGAHRCGVRGRFDPSESSTSAPARCSARDSRLLPSGLRCESCAANKCAYSVNYMEGSHIRGHVQTDVAHFVQSGLHKKAFSARIYFGCTTSERGLFQSQGADGILGMQPETAIAPRKSRVPSVLASLVVQAGSRDAFSLCLSDRGGLLLLGGRGMRSTSRLTVPMKPESAERFTLQLQEIRVSTPQLAGAASNRTFASLGTGARMPLNPTQVDSGTTFFFASTPVFKALVNHLQQTTPKLTQVGNKKCGWLTAAELDAMPLWQLIFSAEPHSPLLVNARQYMVEYPPPAAAVEASRYYCATIFDNGNAGTVIGASIMRHREVIFRMGPSPNEGSVGRRLSRRGGKRGRADVDHSKRRAERGHGTITFVDADCDRMTAATSTLRGAYVFQGCSSDPSVGHPQSAFQAASRSAPSVTLSGSAYLNGTRHSVTTRRADAGLVTSGHSSSQSGWLNFFIPGWLRA